MSSIPPAERSPAAAATNGGSTAAQASRAATTEGPRDFFISYTGADAAWAKWIAWQLESAGWTVAIQAWDIREGQNFVLQMHRWAQSARRTLIVLSPDFLTSEFAAAEWAAAFARDPTGSAGLLVPVRVRDCTPTGLLAQVVYVDLVGIADRDAARKRLLEGVGTRRPKSDQEPAMPATREVASPIVAAPEPAWPGPMVILTRRLVMHALRILATAAIAAVASMLFLQWALPQWYERRIGEAAATSLLIAVITAVVAEAVARSWARLTNRRGGAL